MLELEKSPFFNPHQISESENNHQWVLKPMRLLGNGVFTMSLQQGEIYLYYSIWGSLLWQGDKNSGKT
jgi:hypothetical protein